MDILAWSTNTEILKLTLLLLLLLSCFSRVWLCATPETAAHQAPLSLGFSRQEHWSGLPFPSPMHESEKSKWSCSVVSDSLQPCGLQPTRILHPWDFPGKSTGVFCHCLLRSGDSSGHESVRNSIPEKVLQSSQVSHIYQLLFLDTHQTYHEMK